MTDDIDNDGTTLHESGGVVQPTDAQIDALRDHYKALGFPVDWYRAFARAVLALAVPQALLQAEPVRQLPTAATVKTIMLGMAHDDRLGSLWESSSADEKAIALKVLRVATLATPQAEPAVAEQAREVDEATAMQGGRWVSSADIERMVSELVARATGEAFQPTKMVDGYRAIAAALASQSTPPPESAGQGLSDAEIDSVASTVWEHTDDEDRLREFARAILAANPTAQPGGGSKAKTGSEPVCKRCNGLGGNPLTSNFTPCPTCQQEPKP